jgi:hypothetical protein
VAAGTRSRNVQRVVPQEQATTASPIPRLVIDANILVGSPRLSSGAWRAALHAELSGAFVVCVPEVCLIEAAGWFSREVPRRVTEFRKAAGQLEHLGFRIDDYGGWGSDSPALRQMELDLVNGYDEYLRERLAVGTVLPTPDVPHAHLVRRAVDRRKPFKETGAGYRDALIWESVCLLAETVPVIFVSDNAKDFAGPDGALAEELQEDLELRGLERHTVTLVRSLMEVVSDLAPEAVDARLRVQRVLEDQRAISDLEDQFADGFGTYDGIPYPEGLGELHPLMDDPTVEAVWDIRDVQVQSVKPIGDATYVAFGTATATARAYSRCDDPDPALVDAIHRAVTEGSLDHAEADGSDFVLVKHSRVRIAFEANVDPHSTIWNAGVVDVYAL